MTTSIMEIQTMTDSEKIYRIYERMEEMYLTTTLDFPGYKMQVTPDFKKALEAKWGMLVWQGGSL